MPATGSSGSRNDRRFVPLTYRQISLSEKLILILKRTVMQRFLARKFSGNALATSPPNAKRPRETPVHKVAQPCRPTFVFDPDGRFLYYWKMVVSVAFLYNLWIIGYRFAFDEINRTNIAAWFCLDYLADTVYIVDVAIGFRTAFLEDGVLQKRPERMRLHYFNTPRFYFDLSCLLPIDLLYLSWGFCSLFRAFRLVKIYRFFEFNDIAERHSSHPTLHRLILLTHWFMAIVHWNACFLFTQRSEFRSVGLTSIASVSADNSTWSRDNHVVNYLIALYVSGKFLTLTELPTPAERTKTSMSLVIFELVIGIMALSAILGFVANMVACSSAAKKDFQNELDAVKTYMNFHKVPQYLQAKVIRWFDYLWYTQRASYQGNPMSSLPNKLQAEIALNVHLDTLRKVEIFQNTEPGFLQELVLRLQPLLCSPGDYVCRKGEVGREMYIVSHGKLKVIADDGSTVLATLRAGSYFGEIAILNMGVEGNRRTASVMSVGYSDLFCLTKDAICQVLQDYPDAKMRLEQIAQKRLRQKRCSPARSARGYSTGIAKEESKSACSAPGVLDEISMSMPIETSSNYVDSNDIRSLTPSPCSIASYASHCRLGNANRSSRPSPISSGYQSLLPLPSSTHHGLTGARSWDVPKTPDTPLLVVTDFTTIDGNTSDDEAYGNDFKDIVVEETAI